MSYKYPVLRRAVLGLGLLALPAMAGTIQLQPAPNGAQQMIVFEADQGQRNQVVIEEISPGRVYQISDLFALTAGPGCVLVNAFTARCASQSNVSLSSINATLKNRDDIAQPKGVVSVPLVLKGKVGDDTLDGGNGNDSLKGGEGNDTLRGNAGDDDLVGGGGIDLLDGGPGDDNIISQGDGQQDTVICGNGQDSVVADGFDTVSPDCERFQPFAPPDVDVQDD